MDERIATLGSTPINDASPTGENAKYEDEYELLSAELAKLEAVSADGGVDWQLVVDLSVTILSDKSKDLLVACYLAHGLFQREGLTGLGAGLLVIDDLLTTFYDDLFPPLKRVKARANALSWLADKTEPMVAAMDPKVNDFEAFDLCLTHVNQIQGICDDKMGDNGPTLGAFRRALKNWRDHLKGEVDKQQAAADKAQAQAEAAAAPASDADSGTAAPAAATPAAAAPAKPAAVSVAPVAPVGELGDDKDVKAAIKSIQDVSRKIAVYKRQANPADPLAYSLLRMAIWMQLERLPPSEGGVTALPEIDSERQQALQSLLDQGAFADLLNAAENAFCDAMFWLSVHRYTAAALDGLGHSTAKQAVVQAVAGFVSRFPGITELKFESGLPFVDDMTQVWLQEQAAGASPGSSGGGGANPWDSALQQAMGEAANGKVSEGLQQLQQASQGAADDRQRFMWQLAIGQYFSKSGNVQLAVPQLEYLWQQMQARGLMEWESDASLALARSLLACYDNNEFQNSMNEQRVARYQELKSVLYRLDMQTALMVESK